MINKPDRYRFRTILSELISDDARKLREVTRLKFGSTCFKCGDLSANSVDHHNPASCGFTLGGKNNDNSNAVLLCRYCNDVKKDVDPKIFYNKEELMALKDYYNVHTAAHYNRNFNVEVEFLYEIIKDQPVEIIRDSVLHIMDKYEEVDFNTTFVISPVNYHVDITYLPLLLHIERLLVLDPQNVYFKECYNVYAGEEVKDTPIPLDTTADILPFINKERTEAYDWSSYIGESISVTKGPISVISDDKVHETLRQAVSNNRHQSDNWEEVIVTMRYVSPESNSKKISVAVLIGGQYAFSFKMGSYSSLSRLYDLFSVRLSNNNQASFSA
jgi:5-methylcytosine-specific restriction endonuclease McrA